ncbi:hypothetical protein AGMMS4956_15570 [Bacteroidia bacterium]|nr:hypothetical protein AGMMS4956_15570 [Bacteroidia bacterium]
MLNLKQLEKQLDDALNNETSDSLTQWLLTQRNSELETVPFEAEFVKTVAITSNMATVDYSYSYNGADVYAMAA